MAYDKPWYNKIDTFIQNQGLQRNEANYNMYFYAKRLKKSHPHLVC